MCRIARSVINDASLIRGLKIKKPVPCLVHGQEQVKRYVLSILETKVPPRRLALEELAYKTIGMLPESFQYSAGVVELYVSQIGGYYDPDQKHFVMAGWLPESVQPTIAVHELTHALQDQYYNLGPMMDSKNENSDKLLAYSALVEGDATAVMMDYARRQSGQRPLASEADVESLMMQNLVGAFLVSGEAVPESLKLLLLFPYTSGLRFAHGLLRRGGYSEIDKVFPVPPQTTEEILHPEKYGSGSREYTIPTDADLLAGTLGDNLGFGPDSAVEYRDTIGEFGISTLLASGSGDPDAAAEAASGWGGDRLIIVRDGSGAQRMRWLTRWDTPKDAAEFFERYRTNLQQRFGGALKTGAVGGQRSSGNDSAAVVDPSRGMILLREDDRVWFESRIVPTLTAESSPAGVAAPPPRSDK